MPAPAFPDHTLESAPAAARRSMEAVVNKQGHLPAAVSRLATSPQLLDGFLKISAIFESTTLDPLSREVLIMTIATRNDCHVCVAMHTAKLTALGADADLIAALRTERPLSAERPEAVRQFILAVIATAGAVDDAALQDFLAHGYTPQNALEVVLGIGAYTMSTLANRMTGAPVDPQLAEFAPAPM
ncbi:carboxymuconolactone decarboxylase family protein [Streptomyces sp. NBC_01637]|uniref:carboxymuconolactone decarboxylase family protein n=1 Tax=unclassified Streptomyces TaxID=2593676 RepID=UPI00386F9783|nr:carboxymuconolactone decarboxylase family protein [Streptomyces sp. NBC_01653]WTD88573.1 carboxymuconolactone decarboxylase family protein [Streptomyces sp. NBC_01637]